MLAEGSRVPENALMKAKLPLPALPSLTHTARCWLMFRGSWDQLQINLDTTSPVMEVSMGWFYGSGLLFSVLAALALVNELIKLATGQLSEEDLIGVTESDDMPHGDPHQ